MASLGDLAMRLGVDLSGFYGAMGDMNDKLKAAEKEAQKSFGGFEALGDKLTGLGTAWTAAVTLPIAALGGIAAKAATDFDEAMDTIRAGTGATGAQLQSLGTNFTNVFTSVPVSADQAASAIADLNTRLGLTGKPLEDMATQMLNLARIAGTEVGPLIAAGTRLFGDWSVATENQSAALDFMWKTAQSTGIGVQRLMELVVQFGAPLRALGFDMESAAALMGKWEKEGVNLETVLSGLRFALGNFAKAGQEPKQALQDVIERIKSAKTESEATAISFETFGKRAAIDMGRAIIEGRFEIDELVKSLKTSGETINKAAEDTLSFGEKWTLFKNKLEAALVPLGSKLIDVLTRVMEGMQPLLAGLASLVSWFANLPEPVQNFGIALGAALAVVGPLALGIGGLISAVTSVASALAPVAAAVGVTTGALAGWLAVIPLVVAALVALGVWVYDNWEAITATLAQAWDGIKEVWGAVWGFIYDQTIGKWVAFAEALGIWEPIKSFFATLWDGTKSVFVGTWNAIKDALVWVWEAIATSASRVWSGIVSVFQTFLEWAGKIPGVNKLMNLDEAWASAKKLEQQTAKTAEATKDLAGESKKTGAQIQKTSDELDKSRIRHKSHAEVVHELGKKNEILTETYRRLEAQHKKSIAEIVKWRSEHDTLEKRTPQYIQATDGLNESVAAVGRTAALVGSQIQSLGKILDEEMKTAAKAPVALEEAYKKLGITSSKSLQDQAAEAKKQYEIIKNSGTASARDIEAAWAKMERARIDAAKAAGQQIPKEAEDALKKVEERLGDHTKKTENTWSEWSKQVSTIVTDFGKDIAKALWEGDTSFGEKGLKMLKSLGESVTRMFVEPATKALGDFIGGVISDLMGGKGFGGVIDRIKDMGKVFSDVWSGISGKTSGGIPGVPGTSTPSPTPTPSPSPSPKPGPTGGGAAGGVMGAVNMATGIISAGANVISAIYNIRQEGTLNAIEQNTRYGMIHSLYILDHVNSYLPKLEDISGFLWDVYISAFASLMTTVEEIRDMLKGSVSSVLGDRRADTNEPAVIAGTDTETLGEMLNRIGDDLLATLRPMAAQVSQIIDPWLIDIHGMHRQFYTGKPWDSALDKVINGKQTTIIEFVLDGRKFAEAIIDDFDAVAGRRLQVIGQRVS